MNGYTVEEPIVFKAERKWGAVLPGRGNAAGFGITFDAGVLRVAQGAIHN